MAEQPARLQELAQLLRGAHHLGAEERGELAQLLEELHQALAPGQLSEESRKHLEENAGHLVQALHGQAEEGLLASARKRLEESAVRLEAETPQVTGVVRRLIDAIANLGI